jgi:1-pyrroline-5-carboxylate dehydrogenase
MATLLEISNRTLRVPTTPFKNEPLTDFGNAENARKMKTAISKVRAELGREYDMVIGEKLVRTTEKIKSVNPAKPSEIVGVFQSAGREHVEPAIQAAQQAFETWKRTTVEQRASLIHTVAGILRERKFEFAAWMVFEVGKNWAEADADVAETIDFAEFYAREALRLAQAKTPTQLPGEADRLIYIPLVVAALNPQWTFPCEIMAGMTMAAIVTGNTVVMTP